MARVLEDGFKALCAKVSKWQYHQKVAKLLVAIRHIRKGEEIHNVNAWRSYIANELYGSEGDAFKLNLFPLSSPSVDSSAWQAGYADVPELRNKRHYYDLCRSERFSFLRKIRETHKPKVIVATGTSFREDFVSAFGFGGCTQQMFEVVYGGRTRSCFHYKDGVFSLVVAPFFGGRHGMNSNGLLLNLAHQLTHRTLI